MKNKILLKIFLIIITLFVLGLVTSYKDSARVRAGIEPKYAIKKISQHGNKVTYWGLGYKVIRYVNVSPNESFKNNKGVKYGSWFMEYELDFDKKVVSNYSKSISDITINLNIPDNWKYEEMPLDENTKFSLKIYKNENDYFIINYNINYFGVCGTGREEKELKLNNGKIAKIGYYDGSKVWSDISLYDINPYISLINHGTDDNEVLNFIKTIDIKNNK